MEFYVLIKNLKLNSELIFLHFDKKFIKLVLRSIHLDIFYLYLIFLIHYLLSLFSLNHIPYFYVLCVLKVGCCQSLFS